MARARYLTPELDNSLDWLEQTNASTLTYLLYRAGRYTSLKYWGPLADLTKIAGLALVEAAEMNDETRLNRLLRAASIDNSAIYFALVAAVQRGNEAIVTKLLALPDAGKKLLTYMRTNQSRLASTRCQSALDASQIVNVPANNASTLTMDVPPNLMAEAAHAGCAALVTALLNECGLAEWNNTKFIINPCHLAAAAGHITVANTFLRDNATREAVLQSALKSDSAVVVSSLLQTQVYREFFKSCDALNYQQRCYISDCLVSALNTRGKKNEAANEIAQLLLQFPAVKLIAREMLDTTTNVFTRTKLRTLLQVDAASESVASTPIVKTEEAAASEKIIAELISMTIERFTTAMSSPKFGALANEKFALGIQLLIKLRDMKLDDQDKLQQFGFITVGAITFAMAAEASRYHIFTTPLDTRELCSAADPDYNIDLDLKRARLSSIMITIGSKVLANTIPRFNDVVLFKEFGVGIADMLGLVDEAKEMLGESRQHIYNKPGY